MSEQLVTSFQQLITPARIETFKDTFGDEPDQVSDSFSASLPVILNGIMSKCSTVDGTGKILHAAREINDKQVLSNPGNLFSGGGEWMHYGGNLLHTIFGDQENHIVQKMADITGAKNSSSHGILKIASVMILGLVGKHVADNKMDNKGFIHYLMAGVGSLIPAGLNTAFGLADNDDLKHKLQAVSYSLGSEPTPHHAAVHHVAEPAEKKKGMVLLAPALLLALLATFVLWLSKGSKAEPAEPMHASESVSEAVKVAVIDTAAHTIKLPDGSLFHVSKGTMEYKLVEFLNDEKRAAGKDVWFDFDNVNFDIDKASLTSESKMQLDNIAAILLAYPKTKVKVGGYTDKTGNEAHNLQLSQERADTIFSAFKERKVVVEQLQGAEGYGSQFATMPATASTEQRRVDRRMALGVREK